MPRVWLLKMLSHDEVVDKLYKRGLEDTVCKYCVYGSDCSKSVNNYGNGPIFPPCAELPAEHYFNLGDYLESEEGD